MMNMTREQYMDLFGLTEMDAGMEYADEEIANGEYESWYELAKANIATISYLASKC